MNESNSILEIAKSLALTVGPILTLGAVIAGFRRAQVDIIDLRDQLREHQRENQADFRRIHERLDSRG